MTDSDDELLDRLAAPYAVAVRLERAGASPALIAEALGLPPEAVPGHLALAHAKLQALYGAP